MNDRNISESAAALHADALVWDMTLPWLPTTEPKEGVLDRFHKAGFNFVGLTVAVDNMWLPEAINYLTAETARLRAQADKLVLATSVDDILRAKTEGKLAVGFHFQGTNPLQGDVGMVQTYYDLGIRHLLLAYNQKNLVGDGCHERTDAGLSRFGLKLIEEMNRLGMLVDCTHTGHRTTMEAMEASTAPCIFSHSVCRALNDHERNIWDDQIRACAESGGVIGLNGVGMFLDRSGAASIEIMCRHVDHIAALVGPQHVGIGLDLVYFEEIMYAYYWKYKETMYPTGYPEPPWQFFQPEQTPALTEALLERGYSESDVRGILGENFLRVCRQVWK